MSKQIEQPTSNQSLVTAALVIAGAAGVGVFLLMPAIASALVEVWGFNNDQVGDFSFAQLGFVSFGCIVGMFAGSSFSIRKLTAIGLIVLTLMELLSPQIGADNYSTFLIVRAISGTAGGMCVALATGALAQLPGAERNFGLFLFAQISLSMIGILVVPYLINLIGIGGAFYPLAALSFIVLVTLTRFLPNVPVAALGATMRTASDQNSVGPRNSKAAWLYSVVSLVSILAFFVGIGAFWTFVKLIGEQSGLSGESAGLALSLAGIGGLVGSMIPVFLKTRWGNFSPLLLAFITLVISIYLIANQNSMAAFTLGAMAFSLGWYMYNPYQLGVLAGIDRDGRPAMASAALTGLGLGLGPALVAKVGGEGFSSVYVVSAASFALAFGIIALVIVASRNIDTTSAAEATQ